MARISRGSRYRAGVAVNSTGTLQYFGDFAGGVLIPSSTVNGGTYHIKTAATSTSTVVPLYDKDALAVTLTISSTEQRAYEIPSAAYGAQWLVITTTGTADSVDFWFKG